jgi:hypothetical protein
MDLSFHIRHFITPHKQNKLLRLGRSSQAPGATRLAFARQKRFSPQEVFRIFFSARRAPRLPSHHPTPFDQEKLL